jgi:outer membrane biosynthesis protein TonB
MPPPLVVGGPDQAIVNRMELVISTDGTVERVRLVSEPRRMADMMLLSGAKLWRFAPAVRDGVPVRYRTTLSWTVFP